MATEIYESENLTITRKCGPASMGGDRTLWQFTLPRGHDWTDLTRKELAALVSRLHRELYVAA